MYSKLVSEPVLTKLKGKDAEKAKKILDRNYICIYFYRTDLALSEYNANYTTVYFYMHYIV